MQETTGWTFPLEKALLLIMDSCFGQKLDMKMSRLGLGVVWCWLLEDYLRIIVLFLSADTYSDGTHSLQSIHWWASDGMLHFYKPDEETNSSTSWMVWRLSTFSEKTHFGVKYSFNIRAIWPGIMRVGSYLDFDCDRSRFQDKYTCTTSRIFYILPFILSLFS